MSTKSTPNVETWCALHFETRQAQWDGFLRSFRQLDTRDGKPRLWEIWVEGDRYFTRHGQLGGKMQNTDKKGKAKNQGRANELSPEQDAMAEARRLTRKKWDFEGYDEFIGDTNVDNRSAGVDEHGKKIRPSIPHLLASLPGSFCMYKPQNNIEDCKTLLKKAEAGEVLYTLKRNGLAMWIVVDGTGAVHMYSRRNRPSHKNEGPFEEPDGTLNFQNVIPWVNRFPHLVEAVLALKLPANTMMACELVSMNGDTKKDFAHVCSIEKSLTPAAIEKQAARGQLGLYWWDIPFFGGTDLVSTWTVIKRYQLICAITARAPASWIQPIEHCKFDNTKAAIEFAKEHKLEGWVVVDPEGVYGDRGWNLKGKPDRPRQFCAKLKPYWEDDFIAFWNPADSWGTFGKGKHEPGKKVTLPNKTQVVHGGVGSVGLGQYNNKGKLIYIADCSSGMSYELQSSLSSVDFPFVCEVKYNDRSFISEGADTNALTFPVFVRLRPDKKLGECIHEKL